MTTVPAARPSSDLDTTTTADRLVDSACTLFAPRGPGQVSLRDVATLAGCSHALVARHFGGRAGLEAAVAAEVGRRVDAVVTDACEHGSDPIGDVTAALATSGTTRQLLVRTGLGELDPGVLAAPGNPVERLAAQLPPADGDASRVGDHARIRAYAAAATIVGWLTFEPFLVQATGIHTVPSPTRVNAIAAAARLIGWSSDTVLTPGQPPAVTTPTMDSDGPGPIRGRDQTRRALVSAAVELFATRSPGSVTTRELAAHAGVNQGLIYRHFGSKEAIITAALDAGVAGLLPATQSRRGFDLAAVVTGTRHHTPAATLIARTLIDGIDIATVRSEFPVVQRLIASYPDTQPTHVAGQDPLSDPRLAVAAATSLVAGSAVWDGILRAASCLGPGPDLDAPLTTLAGRVVAAAGRSDAVPT